MLVELERVLELIEEMQTLAEKCKNTYSAKLKGGEKEITLAMLDGQIARLNGLAKLLQDPRFPKAA